MPAERFPVSDLQQDLGQQKVDKEMHILSDNIPDINFQKSSIHHHPIPFLPSNDILILYFLLSFYFTHFDFDILSQYFSINKRNLS